MSTQTELIAAAIVSKLTTAGLTVRTSSDRPWSYEDMPAVLVDVGAERPQPVVGGTGGYIYWDLDVTLWIVAMGDSPKLAPEATRQTAHAALYADRTLGGKAVDITASQVSRQIDNDNPAQGITQATYHIIYRIGEATV